ncbi:alveolar macrophage chemotactic factor [Ochotona princeps]|uniref:alveolar macrophage chemotactic factor n=1 Tax=Ochotona princeps TaxID=9978 RepID=UPI002714FBAA|nr:alveolar macrophage chemotactic factor [Ochotona princeps]
MSLQFSTARVPGLSGSLCALLALLLLLLTPPAPVASAGPSAVGPRELRCICLTTMSVHPKMISSLQVTAAGVQCPKVEVIAVLKNGNEVCLDAEAPVTKRIIQKILKSGNKKD